MTQLNLATSEYFASNRWPHSVSGLRSECLRQPVCRIKPTLSIIAGGFADHLHNERMDCVRLDVLDLQNLLAVLLCHRSQLCQAGYHFGVQQTEAETVMGERVQHFMLSGPRATLHSLFFGAHPLTVDPGFERERQVFVDSVDRTVLLHSRTIWWCESKQNPFKFDPAAMYKVGQEKLKTCCYLGKTRTWPA